MRATCFEIIGNELLMWREPWQSHDGSVVDVGDVKSWLRFVRSSYTRFLRRARRWKNRFPKISGALKHTEWFSSKTVQTRPFGTVRNLVLYVKYVFFKKRTTHRPTEWRKRANRVEPNRFEPFGSNDFFDARCAHCQQLLAFSVKIGSVLVNLIITPVSLVAISGRWDDRARFFRFPPENTGTAWPVVPVFRVPVGVPATTSSLVRARGVIFVKFQTKVNRENPADWFLPCPCV